VGAGTTARAGQIPGMTPREGQALQESQRAQSDQRQPCQPAPGQPQRRLTGGSVRSWPWPHCRCRLNT